LEEGMYNMKRLLTLTEVLEIRRLKRSTIYAYVAARKIPHVKLGRKLFFDENDILKWIESKKVAPVCIE
jgi:excisionase family DNA binding protein